MKEYKIAIFVATGYEDVELITVVDIFDRAKLNFDLISIENKILVSGAHHSLVKTAKISQTDFLKYQGFLIPGGPGSKLINQSPEVQIILKKAFLNQKDLYAICAGPEVFYNLGFLDKKKFTSYPGYANNKYNTALAIEINNKMITAKSMRYSLLFALAIVEKVAGMAKRKQIEEKL